MPLPPVKCDYFGQMAPKPQTTVQYVTRHHITKWKNAVVISDQIGNDYTLVFHHCICAWNFLVSKYPLKFSKVFCFLLWKIAHLLYSITIPFICRSRMPEFIMIGFLRVTLRSLYQRTFFNQHRLQSMSIWLLEWTLLTGFFLDSPYLNSPHSHSQSTKAALALVMESWSNILRSTPFSTWRLWRCEVPDTKEN